MPQWVFETDPDGLPTKPPPATMSGQELHPSQSAKVEAIISDSLWTALVRRSCMGEVGLRPTDVVRAYERAVERSRAISEHWSAYILHRAHGHLWDLKQQGITDPVGPGVAERLEVLEGRKGKAA